VTERREDLSTADLAGQRPAEPVRVEHVEDEDPDRVHVDRDGVEETDVDRSDVDRSDVDRSDVDRDGVEETDVDRSDVDPTDLDRTDVDRFGSERGGVGRSDLDRDDTHGSGARDGERRDTERVGDVDAARSDDYDTDVTPAQARGGSTVADPDALGDRTPAGAGPLNGSTRPGAGTTAPDAGSAPVSGTTGPGAGTAGPTTGTSGADTGGSLLGANDTEGFRARWTDVQTGFVDEPRRAVEQADGLVAELMQHLATTFADERTRLEGQWDSGDDVQTDDLRAAFQRYRSFFERLLAN
jgi:hypothetical protein